MVIRLLSGLYSSVHFNVHHSCSFLHPPTKHLNRLRDILVYSCSGVKTLVDCVRLTQGGSMIKLQCQPTVVGGACAKVHHIALNLITACSETMLMIYVN